MSVSLSVYSTRTVTLSAAFLELLRARVMELFGGGWTRQGCREYEALAAAKASILDFVETRMTSMAPNVCALVGSRITAKLLALTGGLTAMSKTPSCNLQVRCVLLTKLATTPRLREREVSRSSVLQSCV